MTLFHIAERALAAAALVAASPALFTIALAIVATDGRPVFFRQTRVGLGGRPFRIWKFRTMRKRAGTRVTAANDSRITGVGRLLRRYKLDEIPQLFNVAAGQMSLIGPRPEVPEFVDHADPVWRGVLSVRPGITDLATIVYRDEERLLGAAPDPERFYREAILPRKLALNLRYAASRTWRSDLKLLRLTIQFSLRPGRFDAGVVARQFVQEEAAHDSGFHPVPSAQHRRAGNC
jgi:lipopolysaccharide/colanic/teichoic acid biosynthesis glycosyltransferase